MAGAHPAGCHPKHVDCSIAGSRRWKKKRKKKKKCFGCNSLQQILSCIGLSWHFLQNWVKEVEIRHTAPGRKTGADQDHFLQRCQYYHTFVQQSAVPLPVPQRPTVHITGRFCLSQCLISFKQGLRDQERPGIFNVVQSINRHIGR